MRKYFIRGFIGGLLFAGVACSPNPREKNFDYFPNMIHPVPVEAYRGKMLHAPAGTIALGETPYPYENNDAGLAAAEKDWINPLPNTPENLARGQEVYTNNCLMCHGAEGKGDGQLIPRFTNPPSFTSRSMQGMTAGHVYHVITYGFGDMKSHAQQITPVDRWRTAMYIKKLQEMAAPPAAAAAPSTASANASAAAPANATEATKGEVKK